MNSDISDLAKQRIYMKTIFSWNDVDVLWFGDFSNGKYGCLSYDEALREEIKWLENKCLVKK